MKEYVKNTKTCVENMKEYVDILDLAHSSHKNSDFSPFRWALGLGKIPRPSFLLSSGT